MKDEIGEAMQAAINARVQRHAKVESRGHGDQRGATERPRWSPPRCARPGCSNAADISERDWRAGHEYAKERGEQQRDYFCSKGCFKIVRDAIHGRRGRWKQA